MSEPVQPSQRRLLVTGGGGFLGWNLARRCAATWDAHATWRRSEATIPGVRTHRVDLTDGRALRELMRAVQPDAVIHAAAVSQPNDCERMPAVSRRINVDAAIELAGRCADAETPFLFISSDLVFNGEHAPYSEDDPVCPTSVYGEQKVAAEAGVLDHHPDATICRMSLMFGPPAPASRSFIQPFLERMRAGQELRLFQDEYRPPLSVWHAIKGLLLALEKRPTLLHLGGAERISRYDFGLMMASVLGIDSAVIHPCSQSDLPMPAFRPREICFDLARARALGFDPPPLARQIEELKGEI